MPDLLLEIGYTLVVCTLLIWVIGKFTYFRQFPFSIASIRIAFAIKLIFGFLLTAVYTYYYTDRNTADIYKYFDDSYYMYQALESNPIDYFKMLLGIGNNSPHFDLYYSKMAHWSREYDSNMFSDSHLIIRFNALIRVISFGCIHIHTAIACFLSLIGLLQISKLISSRFNCNTYLLLVAIFGIPSTLFWGSGVLKEAIILFATGILLSNFDYSIRTKKLSLLPTLLILLAIILLLFSKIYILIGILPGLIAWFFNEVFQPRNKLFSHIIAYSIILFFGIFGTNGLELISKKRHDFIEHAKGGTIIERIGKSGQCDTLFLEAKYHNYWVKQPKDSIKFNRLCKGILVLNDKPTDSTIEILTNSDYAYTLLLDYGTVGSRINTKELEPNFFVYLLELPTSIFQVLLRPFPNEIDSFFKLLAFIENLLFSLCLYKLWKNRKLLVQSNLAITSILFTIVVFALIGYTTPIFGAIMRYKCLAYPLIVPLAFIQKREVVDR